VAAAPQRVAWSKPAAQSCFTAARAVLAYGVDRFLGFEPSLRLLADYHVAAGEQICRTACGDTEQLRIANAGGKK